MLAAGFRRPGLPSLECLVIANAKERYGPYLVPFSCVCLLIIPAEISREKQTASSLAPDVGDARHQLKHVTVKARLGASSL